MNAINQAWGRLNESLRYKNALGRQRRLDEEARKRNALSAQESRLGMKRTRQLMDETERKRKAAEDAAIAEATEKKRQRTWKSLEFVTKGKTSGERETRLNNLKETGFLEGDIEIGSYTDDDGKEKMNIFSSMQGGGRLKISGYPKDVGAFLNATEGGLPQNQREINKLLVKHNLSAEQIEEKSGISQAKAVDKVTKIDRALIELDKGEKISPELKAIMLSTPGMEGLYKTLNRQESLSLEQKEQVRRALKKQRAFYAKDLPEDYESEDEIDSLIEAAISK